MQNLSIVTINTWKCDGDYFNRLLLMAEELKAISPDIVACQECFQLQDGVANTLGYLAEHLGMHHLFLPGRNKPRYFEGKSQDSLSGLGILSRFPLTELPSVMLPLTSEDDERKLQQAMVTLPNGENVLFTNLHLTHISDAGNTRLLQIEKLSSLINQNLTNPNHFICGDFNATSLSIEIKTLFASSNISNLYEEGDGVKPCISLAPAYYDFEPVCVDFIFAQVFPNATKHKVLKSSIVLNQYSEAFKTYPSDHFGIFVEIEFPNTLTH
jgi:endonuclease/exonuclease/phosphatase family metal-dependent hydrolase